MRDIFFVIGGCRSGKSSHALKIADQLPGNNKYFIATLEPYDSEMKQRVLLHQKERDKNFITIEEPLEIGKKIKELDNGKNLFLIDCITLWISNLLLLKNDPDYVMLEVEKLIQSIDEINSSLIIVSNEVGTGIVPENKLARQYRDLTGFANQKIAKKMDNVIWMVAGIPVKIK